MMKEQQQERFDVVRRWSLMDCFKMLLVIEWVKWWLAYLFFFFLENRQLKIQKINALGKIQEQPERIKLMYAESQPAHFNQLSLFFIYRSGVNQCWQTVPLVTRYMCLIQAEMKAAAVHFCWQCSTRWHCVHTKEEKPELAAWNCRPQREKNITKPKRAYIRLDRHPGWLLPPAQSVVVIIHPPQVTTAATGRRSCLSCALTPQQETHDEWLLSPHHTLCLI